ncbi:MAG TPA: thioredoxin family protein [Candidatus Omnitrophota bacterium]|nr:thioredoxin family protein [Candidatus Omnitrophota bacterium]
MYFKKHMPRLFLVIFSFNLLMSGCSSQSQFVQAQKSTGVMVPEPVTRQESVEQKPALAPTTNQTEIPPSVAKPLPAWAESWYQGASGYEKAVEEYKRTNKPLAVYVSVRWCPYCRKFENQILSSPLVMQFLKDKIKVNINPETSEQESNVVRKYGVRGFPTFFVHPPQPSQTEQLYTSGTPEEFVSQFEDVIK